MFDVKRAVPFKDVEISGFAHLNLIGLDGSVIGVFNFLDVDFKVIPGLKQSPAIDPQSKIIGFSNADEAYRRLPEWGVGIFAPLV